MNMQEELEDVLQGLNDLHQEAGQLDDSKGLADVIDLLVTAHSELDDIIHGRVPGTSMMESDDFLGE